MYNYSITERIDKNMEHHQGQIAEYGTKEFNDNQSIYTVLDRGLYTNPHGLKYPAELYHRTKGYKIAGSCATWTEEVWGYKIFWNDGTNGGKYSPIKNDILMLWENVKK